MIDFNKINDHKWLNYKYSPLILAVILLLIQFLAGYPGGMTPDSFDQYNQSLTGSYNPYHPPVMSILWSLFNNIMAGPQIMLILNLLLLWTSVLIFYYIDEVNKYRFIYFIIPFLPPIFSQSLMIWKDVAFSNALLLATAISSYYYLKKEKSAPFFILILVLLISFYATSVKFQAKYLCPFLIWFLVSASFRMGVIKKIFLTAIVSIIIIQANDFIIRKLAYEEPTWQFRVFFDLAAISKDKNDDGYMPKYVKEHKNYSFVNLKDKFHHKYADPMIWPDDRIYDATDDQNNLSELRNSFINAVTNHPFLYLKHRITNFSHIMMQSYNCRDFAIIDGKLKDKFSISDKRNFVHHISKIVLCVIPKFLSANIWSFFIFTFYLYFIFISRKQPGDKKGEKKKLILKLYILIWIAFSIIILLTTQAADYRYYYLIRLLSFMLFPIYMQLRSQKYVEAK